MKSSILSKSEIEAHCQKLWENSLLGRADLHRMDELERLLHTDGRLDMAQVLTTLFPGKEIQVAQRNLRAFRKRVNDALKEEGIDFRFCADSNKKDPSP